MSVAVRRVEDQFYVRVVGSEVEKAAVYARALNVVDGVLSAFKWAGVKADRSPLGTCQHVRVALNELVLVAPANVVSAFMAVAGFGEGPVSIGTLVYLRDAMREDLGLSKLAYSDAGRVWLAALGVERGADVR